MKYLRMRKQEEGQYYTVEIRTIWVWICKEKNTTINNCKFNKIRVSGGHLLGVLYRWYRHWKTVVKIIYQLRYQIKSSFKNLILLVNSLIKKVQSLKLHNFQRRKLLNKQWIKSKNITIRKLKFSQP